MSKQSNIIPNHVGIILDGNRRWAKSKGLTPMDGHKAGFESFKKVSEAGLDKGIKFLSAFAFSTENWQRSKDEVSFLMSFIQFVMKKYINELQEKNIRFIWLGSEDGLSKKIINQLRRAEDLSKNNTRATFCLCFNYGGYQEIVDGANKLLNNNQAITAENLGSAIYGGNEVPPVDLLIRTSGEERISNFMLWRVAYSELYFSNKLWPDFTPQDLDVALNEYAHRQRRFGA
ncbi:MAG: polyprenyl diphosphate synthase [Patescibacteria group bacterium]|jgi:undecaprenyl diphosphate synthase|nr:polyprenyl diphosphate synthase [Patescibacteria group bacterium]